MKIMDWILLALIVGYCLWLVLRKKKTKCSGNCDGCQGCR